MERPQQVADNAVFNEDLEIWVSQTIDIRTSNTVGDYYEWDKEGNLSVKRLYGPGGTILEHYAYNNGKLDFSEIIDVFDKVITYYYQDMDPQGVRERTMVLDDYADVTTTFFDKAGNELYTIRQERINDNNEKRYYNGILVAEGIETPDNMAAAYYSPDGDIIIDYTYIAENSGIWTKHTTPVQQIFVKADHSLNRWDAFMPHWYGYEPTTENDWDAVLNNFEKCYQKFVIKQKFNALPMQTALQPLIDEVDWHNIYSPGYDKAELPKYINGLLSEDEEIADMCLKHIWGEIENITRVYNSAYKIAGIIAQMIPLQPPTIQPRLHKFLDDVLQLPYVKIDNALLYDEMMEKIRAVR